VITDHLLGEATNLGVARTLQGQGLDSISNRFEDVAVGTNSAALVTATGAGAEAIGVMQPATPSARALETNNILRFIAESPSSARPCMVELTAPNDELPS